MITLGVVLLIIFGVVIINRGGSKNVVIPDHKSVKLTDYSTNNNASVQYYIEGPINAIENHRSMKITVSPNSRNISIFTGYQGQAISSHSYTNDNTSYSAFLAALNRAAFTNERRLGKSVNSDSICPTQNRTHYLIIDNNKDVMNTWSAPCTKGPFSGNIALTKTLFETQIPNYSAVVNSVNNGTASANIY
ncbi:MAG: hypothetical protein WCJ24_01075 [Candidatus Saccharibacteria bacterium]